ncbi:barstar family protein [Microlunatus elymi]|uniref:Barstar family protein n=1 Tax=Microlunatus elymi TaxID=2596828 RepID=A0A516Q325_9ACTN|nr:barstar family protein [Microlunatus elymi]QDP97611.1 barstar family protein [Microlunatus elymi]
MTGDDLESTIRRIASGGVVEVSDSTQLEQRLRLAGWNVRVLDHFSDRQGFYRNIASGLDFPAYSGHNLDALWDSLRAVPPKTAVIIFWQDFAATDPAYADRARAVLTDRTQAGPEFAVILDQRG